MSLSTQQNIRLYRFTYIHDNNSYHDMLFSINDLARGHHLKHSQNLLGLLGWEGCNNIFRVIYDCDADKTFFDVGIFSYNNIIMGEHIKKLVQMGYNGLKVGNIHCELSIGVP